MLVSVNWLKNYVDIGDLTIDQLAEKITRSGIEVDGIDYFAEESTNIVVGYVKTCEKHPNADKLNLCQVDVGGETLQIICGAPNVSEGQKVAVAKPGATLPGGMKIKRVKLRGIESNGMICSLQELGVDEKYIPDEVADGIFVFPEDVSIGEPVQGLLNLDDAILEFDLTPNRSDALSMLGVAYEVAAILDTEICLPDEAVSTTEESTQDFIRVEVEEPELSPYYGAFIIKNIEIKQSPLWMRNYLMAAGIRPINNVVDITNYVLLEYGQPLHAFDYDKFNSDQVVVRRAKEGEKIVTLDDQERILTTEQLVITNGKEPTALAGVMGGANTEVTAETATVLLEAAYFSGDNVRRTVKRTGLRSESSTRFEKGVDPNRVKEAGKRACYLLEKYAGGVILRDVAEFDELNREEKTVEVHTGAVNQRLGTEIKTEEIAAILRKLQFEYDCTDDQFTVHVPTRRQDITIFEDILEEIARIYGYDYLPYTLPVNSQLVGELTEQQLLKRKVKHFLEGAGLMETICYSLTTKENSTQLLSPEVANENPKPISLAMPMTEDHQYLRVSLLPELLKSLSYNYARNQYNLAYYELGDIFITREDELTKLPEERARLVAAVTGKWLEHPWQDEVKNVDFYVIKGIVEGLFSFLNLDVSYDQAKLEGMHPGRCAVITLDGKTIGFLGQIHPMLAKDLDLKETYVFDLNMEEILLTYENVPSYTEIPKYPSITRDIAFILDKDIHAGDVKAEIEKIGKPHLKQVKIFDLYEGEHVPEGKKSIAYNLLYRDPNQTLKDDVVEESYQGVIQAINQKFNAYVRQ